jgi:hypothetical protein
MRISEGKNNNSYLVLDLHRPIFFTDIRDVASEIRHIQAAIRVDPPFILN